MPDNKSPYMKGATWLGLLFLLGGGAVMIQSVTRDMADTTTPRWIGVLFGLMFFNAGITVGLMDSGFNDYRGTKWLSYLHAMALLSIPLAFLTLFNWAAFGPGEREFSMSVSIPFLSFGLDRGSEIIGRIVFGVPALLMDAFLGYVIYGLITDTFGKSIDDIDSET